MFTQIQKIPQGASFLPRMGAWLYDLLILLAIEMLAIAIAHGALALAISLGFSSEGFRDSSDLLTSHSIIGPLFTLYVFLIVIGFFSYFWCVAGQTIGMKAWKLIILNEEGKKITFTQSLIRLATACLGIGNLLVLFDKNNRAFQDHFAQCQIVKQ